MKKEAHRALFSALQVRSLWGHTTTTAWTLSYTICMWFFFPLMGLANCFLSCSQNIQIWRYVKQRSFSLLTGPMGRNPSSQAPTHSLMGCMLWSWYSASKSQSDKNQRHYVLSLGISVCPLFSSITFTSNVHICIFWVAGKKLYNLQ